jgi:hypothetical protein
MNDRLLLPIYIALLVGSNALLTVRLAHAATLQNVVIK